MKSSRFIALFLTVLLFCLASFSCKSPDAVSEGSNTESESVGTVEKDPSLTFDFLTSDTSIIADLVGVDPADFDHHLTLETTVKILAAAEHFLENYEEIVILDGRIIKPVAPLAESEIELLNSGFITDKSPIFADLTNKFALRNSQRIWVFKQLLGLYIDEDAGITEIEDYDNSLLSSKTSIPIIVCDMHKAFPQGEGSCLKAWEEIKASGVGKVGYDYINIKDSGEIVYFDEATEAFTLLNPIESDREIYEYLQKTYHYYINTKDITLMDDRWYGLWHTEDNPYLRNVETNEAAD